MQKTGLLPTYAQWLFALWSQSCSLQFKDKKKMRSKKGIEDNRSALELSECIFSEVKSKQTVGALKTIQIVKLELRVNGVPSP